MTVMILIRHGRSTANARGVLAGRGEGVALDEHGRGQAAALQPVLAHVEHIYSSPMARCVETAAGAGFAEPRIVDDLNECDYGRWTGQSLATLLSEELWAEIQRAPSAVSFPGGESMLAMRDRCVTAVHAIIRRHPDDVVAVFSHGDPIKAILADALAMPFDEFQRIDVAPGSVSVVDYSGAKPVVRLVGGSPASAVSLTPRGHTVGGSDGA